MEDLGPFVIPNSHSHDFTAESNGQVYRVWVATPAKRAPGVVRPVLFTLDANGSFGMVVETARFLALVGEIPPVIVVGVGYPEPGGFRNSMSLRNFELTPVADASFAERSARLGQPIGDRGFGGAPGFLQFIGHELAPVIEDLYGADPTDRALFGYSLGGLFAAWTMLQPDPVFHRFMIGSPSLWWDERMVFGLEATRAEGPKRLPARAYISAGELEEDVTNANSLESQMLTNAVQFARTLARRGYEGFSIELEPLRNAGHEQAPMLAQGLRSIYRGHPGIVRQPTS